MKHIFGSICDVSAFRTSNHVMVLFGVLIIAVGAVSWGGQAEPAPDAPGAVSEYSPPEVPCGVESIAGAGDTVFLLGGCGDIVKWQPSTDAHSVVQLDDDLEHVDEIAVSDREIAILTGGRRLIYRYNMNGRRIAEHRYSGETHLMSLALVPGGVAASTFYDDHLVFLFEDDEPEPVRLIENPRYWPDASPRYASFVDVHYGLGKIFAVDLSNYSVHIVDLKEKSVTDIAMEPHPWWREANRPSEAWQGGPRRYTGERLAVSSAVDGDSLYILWIDRALIRGLAKPGDGYLELAVGALGTGEWETVSKLTDHERFGGSEHLSVVGDVVFFASAQGGVYGIALTGRHPR